MELIHLHGRSHVKFSLLDVWGLEESRSLQTQRIVQGVGGISQRGHRTEVYAIHTALNDGVETPHSGIGLPLDRA